MNVRKERAGAARLLEDKRRFDEADYPGFLDRMVARFCGMMGIGYLRLLRAYTLFAVPWMRIKRLWRRR
jgi:hypothetical protein